MLGWGGLRGAVGIAFAMMVNADTDLDPKYRDIVENLKYSKTIFFIFILFSSSYLIWPEQL